MGCTVLNCDEHTFGGFLKMGDIIAALNVLSYVRKIKNDSTIKLYIPDSAMFGHEHEHLIYIRQFKRFLSEMTDYFSDVAGHEMMWGRWEIWSFRELQGEHIKIKNNVKLEKKICIFPLLDANYNNQRNWPTHVTQNIIDEYSASEYSGYEKIIGIKHESLLHGIDIKDFKISTDFNSNLEHLLSCSHYCGGDTGLSHFVSVLDDAKILNYYYNKGLHGTWRSEFTAPFRLSEGRGKLNFYEK